MSTKLVFFVEARIDEDDLYEQMVAAGVSEEHAERMARDYCASDGGEFPVGYEVTYEPDWMDENPDEICAP